MPKKILAFVALSVAGGVLAVRRVAAERAEAELWREATDNAASGN